jgi:hypothetical protein
MKKLHPVAAAWLSVLIMMIGVGIGMLGMALLDHKVLSVLAAILGIAVFIAGVVFNLIKVRCPHCDTYLGRATGPKCPFCGNDLNK